MAIDLGDYVDVAERIRQFRDKHPDGSLQPADVSEPFRIVGNETEGRFIVYTAAAYRSPDDFRPGIGIAWEPFPGKTPYTKDSELQNAETSAWGRAIVAALAGDTKRGVASAEEVRNRQETNGSPMVGRPATDKQRKMLQTLVDRTGHIPPVWPLPDDLSMRRASEWIDALQAEPKEPRAERRASMRENSGAVENPVGGDADSPAPDSGGPGGAETREGSDDGGEGGTPTAALQGSPPGPTGYDHPAWTKSVLAAQCTRLGLPSSGNRERLVRELRAWNAVNRPEFVEYADPDSEPF